MKQLYETPGGVKRVRTLKDVRAEKFIAKYSSHLKVSGKFDFPHWAEYVKTGIGKELAPYDNDWLYVRAASVIRHLYIRPNTGVGALRKVYGCKKRRGSCPGVSSLASGKVLRYILQQFESLGLVTSPSREKPGRMLTKLGRRELDIIAHQCADDDQSA